jgi:hypothetical protein
MLSFVGTYRDARTRSKPHIMTIEQIRQVLQATPFRPFTVHLADGREIPVPPRQFVAQSPTGRTKIVYHEDESFSIVDLLLVTELEVHNGSPSKARRRKR